MPETNAVASGAMGVVTRLLNATNAHDLSALADCFAADYVNETPVHPLRGFVGREQVRANWQSLFTSIPDLRAEILDSAVDGEVVWSEWRMTGTRPDGSAHELAGVNIFTIRGTAIVRARFYLEPVERQSGTVDDNVRRVATGATS